jgi:predicted RNase H-like nuclease
MIDVPIGLPSWDYRQCDIDARKKVGSSVFLGARRGLCDFSKLADANRHFHAMERPGISIQLWNVRCKIQVVDSIMNPARQESFRETHPELVFWRLNKRTPLIHSKKTDAGRRIRADLLEQNGFTEVHRWMNYRHHSGIGRDDLLDACACALAARDCKSENKVPIGHSPIDDKGLKMEIWY